MFRDRRAVGLVLAAFFLVAAIVMAFDINGLQRNPRLANEIGQLQTRKIVTLFAGGVLAGAALLTFLRKAGE